MNVKFYAFLFFGLFSLGARAEYRTFQPDFKGSPISIPAGTALQPLCLNPANPLCLNQWSQQAVPLAIYPDNSGQISQFQYFLPVFLPSELAGEQLLNDEDWELWNPPPLLNKRRKRTPHRVFYRKKSNPKEIRMVETDEKGNQTVKAVDKDLSSEKDVKKMTVVNESPVGDEKWEVYQSSPGTHQAIYTNRTGEVRVITTNESGQQVEETGSVRFVSTADIKPTNTETLSRPVLKRDSYALSSTTKKVSPAGCFVFDQPEQTEAGFCAECVRNEEQEEPVLSALAENENFWKGVSEMLEQVVSKAKARVASKVAGGLTPEKVCSPEIPLKAIIKNFNDSCPEPYANDFEKFFVETHCESCKKGIPSEIMLAMMSIESAGRCPAKLENEREDSMGLFQINSKAHQCRDSEGKVYRINSPKNTECLKDPINNLNKGVDILADYYAQVNPKALDSSQCKSWLEMSHQERDSWRRGVSAYNSGPKWVKRAIQSARKARTLINTSFLANTTKTERNEFKNDKASWERLRVYYLIEKLTPGNTSGTGRQDILTLSNLAHTEAVLGRNVENASPGMVDIWGQYKQKFLKKNKISCP